jgi:hypothetical protein
LSTSQTAVAFGIRMSVVISVFRASEMKAPGLSAGRCDAML